MFGLGAPEMIVILVVALVIFGPKKLPEMGRSLGKSIREFQNAAKSVKEGIEDEMKDVKEAGNAVKDALEDKKS